MAQIQENKHLRVMLRAMPIEVQNAFLERRCENKSWQRFIKQTYKATWQHKKEYHETASYLMWMLPQRTWYTGIINLARSGGSESTCQVQLLDIEITWREPLKVAT